MIKRTLVYLGSFITLILSYGTASSVVRLLVNFVNSDVSEWVADNIIPYFGAALAGGIGMFAAIGIVERFFETVNLRKLAWIFVAIVVFLFSFSALGIALGAEMQDGFLAMLLQSGVAILVALHATKPIRPSDQTTRP